MQKDRGLAILLTHELLGCGIGHQICGRAVWGREATSVLTILCKELKALIGNLDIVTIDDSNVSSEQKSPQM